MAQTEVTKKTYTPDLRSQPAILTAIYQNRQGIIILDAASYIIRVHFTEKETRELAVRFLPPTP